MLGYVDVTVHIRDAESGCEMLDHYGKMLMKQNVLPSAKKAGHLHPCRKIILYETPTLSLGFQEGGSSNRKKRG